MREWNPLWVDPEDDDNAEYLAAIKRLIVASINWIETHPDFRPKWREASTRSLMRQAGIPDSVAEDTVTIAAAWEDFYQPGNTPTRDWFREMAQACANGKPKDQPSAHMMGKGIAAGSLLLQLGWDEFNLFMLTGPEGTPSDA